MDEADGTLEITSNLAGAPTGRKHESGPVHIDHSVQFNGDGSVAGFTIGDNLISATIDHTPTHQSTGYNDGEVVEEEFYLSGPLSDISGSGEHRHYTYERGKPREETHVTGPWAGWHVEWVQDARGRLDKIHVTGPDHAPQDFTYGYDAHSRLKTSSGLVGADTGDRDAAGRIRSLARGRVTTDWNYHEASGLLQSVVNTVQGGNNYEYTYGSYNARRQILQRVATRGVSWTNLTYDGAGRLTHALLSTGRVADFAYDRRGNRSGRSGYSQGTNGLDQVLGRSLSERGFGVVGSVRPDQEGQPNVAVTVFNPVTQSWESVPHNAQTGAFAGWWNVGTDYQGGDPAVLGVIVRGTLPHGGAGGVDAVAESQLTLVVPPAEETLEYDGAGRLSKDAYWTYTWSAASRLKKMERKPGTFTDPQVQTETVEFTYDTTGRRTGKRHTITYANAPSKNEYSRLLWAGWLPIFEEQSKGGEITGRRWFQWAPDRSGTLAGAGGIGGLVAIREENPDGGAGRTLLPINDGLGNITAVIDAANGQTVSTYDFGPFGEPIGESGEVDACPFRYQSKWYYAESQHYYFGYRHYDPRHGRWLSRDPMGEAGGFNLYAYCGNDPVDRHDPTGLTWNYFSEGDEIFVRDTSGFFVRESNGITKIGQQVVGPERDWVEAGGRIERRSDYSVTFSHEGCGYTMSLQAFRNAIRCIPGDLSKRLLRTTDASERQRMLYDFLITPPPSGGAGTTAVAVSDLIAHGFGSLTSFGEISIDTSGGGAIATSFGLDWRSGSYQAIAQHSPLVNAIAGGIGNAVGAYAGTKSGATLGTGDQVMPGQIIRVPQTAGAAFGSWPIMNEVVGAPGAIKQLTSNMCGHAVTEMLLASRGVVVSQSETLSLVGRERLTGEEVVGLLERFDPGIWTGSVVRPGTEARFLESGYARSGPWGTILHWEGDDHFVLIDGFSNQGNILIRDPWGGSAYHMTIGDFIDVWTNQVVLPPRL